MPRPHKASQCQFRFAAIKMKHGVVEQGHFQSSEDEQGARPLPLLRCLMSKLVGIPKQPIDHRAQEPCADARVVPAIEQAVRAVPLGIIEPTPCIAVLARGRRLTGKQTGCPSAVMRLQTQSDIAFRARSIAEADLIICGTRGSSRCRWPIATARKQQ